MSQPTASITEASTERIRDHATSTAWMRRLFALSIVVALIGWIDTAFLAGIHYAILPLPEGAPVAGTGWEVLTSEWSYLFGIPTALYGSMYYLFVLSLGLLWFTEHLPQLERIFLPVTVVGIASSAVFVYLQLFVIEAVCPFCMISAGTTTVLFFLALAIYLTSTAPPLSALSTHGIDRSTLIWPVALVLVGIIVLMMIHLAATAPLPVPGA